MRRLQLKIIILSNEHNTAPLLYYHIHPVFSYSTTLIRNMACMANEVNWSTKPYHHISKHSQSLFVIKSQRDPHESRKREKLIEQQRKSELMFWILFVNWSTIPYHISKHYNLFLSVINVSTLVHKYY